MKKKLQVEKKMTCQTLDPDKPLAELGLEPEEVWGRLVSCGEILSAIRPRVVLVGRGKLSRAYEGIEMNAEAYVQTVW